MAFKMYLNITGEVHEVASAERPTYDLIFTENPLTEFVELPPMFQKKLVYSQMLCGIIEGALEQVHLDTKATILKDIPNGDDTLTIRLELIQVKRETIESDS